MTTVTLYQDIASFLSESPEWVENWLASPVKKRPSLDDPTFTVNFFNNLPIKQFDKNLKINRDWYKECVRELRERRKYCIKKYWESVEERKKAKKALDKYWETEVVTNSKYKEYYDKYHNLNDKKYNNFMDWIEVDRACLRCGFLNLIGHENLNYYIQMYEDGLDPYKVPSLEAVEAWNRGNIEDFKED